jgi:putative nucleotidyltransferase with HDIG domain
MRVLRLVNDPNVPLGQLSSVISADAAFCSEVLAIANSALVAPRFPVTNIMHATAVLGASRLNAICLTIGVRTYMGKLLNRPAMHGIWRHNLATALIAEQIATSSHMDPAVAYTSGILHDIGRLALVIIRPTEYCELVESHVGSASSIVIRERELFGFDHCQIGGQLAKDWKLPEQFFPVAEQHHQPVDSGDLSSMTTLIKMSCMIADSLGFPAFEGCEVIPFTEAINQLPEGARSLFPSNPEWLSFNIATKIKAAETS